VTLEFVVMVHDVHKERNVGAEVLDRQGAHEREGHVLVSGAAHDAR
jgi:hypothetical protein